MNAPPLTSPSAQALEPLVGDVATPAFVYDLAVTDAAIDRLRRLADAATARLLYSIKACAVPPLLQAIGKRVDGFSVSSWFESRLARSIVADKAAVHLTSPGLGKAEMRGAGAHVSHVSFNSLGQWQRLRTVTPPSVSVGLRVNPQRPFVADDRYNPCRPHSKLGVPLPALQVAERRGELAGLEGLHFHTHCESASYAPLVETIDRLEQALPSLFDRIRWLNLGGGYYADAAGEAALVERVRALRRRFGMEVFMEPGKAFVGDAGSVVATVTDLFDSDGMTIAVLDTSVNHQPEVFEYGRVPPLAEACPDGAHRFVLAGGTCLAGDLFGEYRFTEPLQLGDRVTFTGVGAYSFAKAHHFNGHNLPSLYLRDAAGRLHLVRRFDYRDFAAHWGASS
jgi:carboxynorspermidine decarboxylase